MDISGSCFFPLESLFLFHFITVLILLRSNFYLTKYSLNAKWHTGTQQEKCFPGQIKQEKKKKKTSYVFYTLGSNQNQG